MCSIGFLLLCGGHSSRMGQSKAMISINGQPLVCRIARAGEHFPFRLLSVNDDAIPTPSGFVRIADQYRDCGPMGGLHAALTAAQCDALVVAPCDAPYFDAPLAQYLAAQYTSHPAVPDALILRDASGKIHPLMGVYSKRCLPALTEHLDAKRFKLMRMLDQLNTQITTLPCEIDQRAFGNLNTPQDLEAFLLQLP